MAVAGLALILDDSQDRYRAVMSDASSDVAEAIDWRHFAQIQVPYVELQRRRGYVLRDGRWRAA
jgi:hypothetical protein